MMEESTIMPVEEVGEVLVYEGFLTKLFNTQHLSVPYYSAVMDNLQRMDCVRQMRRGGGTSPSQWALLQPPTTDLWDNMGRTHTPKGRRDRMEGLEQQVRDLRQLVQNLISDFELYKESHP
jgi:archaellum component FlaC